MATELPYSTLTQPRTTQTQTPAKKPWQRRPPLSPSGALRRSILPSIISVHPCTPWKTSFLHRTLLQWSKELAEVLCVSHVHTILPPISRKYVCRRFCCSRVLNTQSTRRRALKLSQDKQDRWRQRAQCVAETADEKSERLIKWRGIVVDTVLRWPVCCSSILLCSHM